MKCYKCEQDLIEESGPIWNVGGRRCVPFKCRESKCIPKVTIHVVLPDEEIVYYAIEYYSNNHWYTIVSSEHGSELYGREWGNNQTKKIIDIKRYYPISWHQPLKPQLEEIFPKLKKLVIFS